MARNETEILIVKSIPIPQMPRMPLANLPTPLEEMPRLTGILGGPRILIKRDDLTGLAFGGSKVRALEFTLADALGKGADTIIAMGESQSNQTRLTAAAAGKLGLKAVLLIAADIIPKKYEGNLHLCRLLGAEIKFAPSFEHEKLVEETVKEVQGNGHIPYVLPFGGTSPIGIMAYVQMAMEMQIQAREMGLTISHIIHASASGGLQTGLTLGHKMMAASTKVISVAVLRYGGQALSEKYRQMQADICGILNADLRIAGDDWCLLHDYSEDGNDKSGNESRITRAMDLVARTEGIILDPQYTGKAMAVLIEMVKQEKFRKEDIVVFIHTGGTPAIFARNKTRSFHIPFNLIRLYNKYGRKHRSVRWFRDVLPIGG